MPRLPRFDLPGFPLHVVQRGNNRQAVFFDDSDYRAYLDWFGLGARQYGVDVHAWLYTTGYVYDPADRLVEMTYPSGLVVSYTRDVLGRVSSVTAFKDGVLHEVATDLDYAPFGPLTALTFGNGIRLTRTLDQDYRLAAQRAGAVQDLLYEYDPASNILKIQDSVNPDRTQTFSYDGVNRLTSAQGDYGGREYSYDAVGNRLTRTANGATDGYFYSGIANQLDSISGPNAETFVYDAAGNTVQKGPSSYFYNDANRFESVQTSGELVAEYRYNAKGERVKKVVAGETTVFHYDQAGNLLAELDGAGNPLRDYIWLDGERLAILTASNGPDLTFTGTNRRTGDEITVGLFLEGQTVEIEDGHGLSGTYALTGRQWRLGRRGILRLRFAAEGVRFVGFFHLHSRKGFFVGRARGRWSLYRLTGREGGAGAEGLFFIHTDHLGTPKVITDEDQDVVWEASHTPFGTALISVNDVENNLRFPGQYFDKESNLSYNRHRYYHSTTGRYLSTDPKGIITGFNHVFGYADQNPLSKIDPSGLEPICADLKLRLPTDYRKTSTKQWESWGRWKFDDIIAEGGDGPFPFLAVKCICVRYRDGKERIVREIKLRTFQLCITCRSFFFRHFDRWEVILDKTKERRNVRRKIILGGFFGNPASATLACLRKCEQLN